MSRLYGIVTRQLMNVELLLEWEVAMETEELGVNPAQCQCVHHRTGITWPDLVSNPDRRYGKPATNLLSKALNQIVNTVIETN
jgi:hypothetical protein